MKSQRMAIRMKVKLKSSNLLPYNDAAKKDSCFMLNFYNNLLRFAFQLID